MDLPRIHYRLTHAKMHIDGDPGRFDIRQPRPTFEMKRIDPKLEIKQPRGDMKIDSSKAYDALGQGGNLETMHRIYAAARNVAMDGIARIVEEGNRLAAIHKGGNPIADNAEATVTGGFPELDFAGEPSYDNVDIFYTARKAEIEVTPGRIDLNAKANNPVIEYQKGKLDIYMKQYPNVEMIPPQIDMKL